jgi:hypothetical protein
MIARIKAAIVRFAGRHDVQSAVRHALTAAGGVFIAAVAVGGVHAVTTAVVIAAGAAALRVLELAVVAHYKARRAAA